jgi:hypothetical protein
MDPVRNLAVAMILHEETEHIHGEQFIQRDDQAIGVWWHFVSSDAADGVFNAEP